MAFPLIPLAIAAGVALYYSRKQNSYTLSGSSDWTASLPVELQGVQPQAPTTETKNGRTYSVMTWPVLTDGRQFCVAVLQGTNNWIAYWHNAKTSKRSLYKSYADGDERQAKTVQSVMLGDWSVG